MGYLAPYFGIWRYQVIFPELGNLRNLRKWGQQRVADPQTGSASKMLTPLAERREVAAKRGRGRGRVCGGAAGVAAALRDEKM